MSAAPLVSAQAVPPARVAADWIAVDWGTSRLRAWAMAADGAPLAEARADAGMGGLTPQDYDAALMALVGGWLRPEGATPVVVCGMAGAREGWAPAPYADIATPLARIAGEGGRGDAARRAAGAGAGLCGAGRAAGHALEMGAGHGWAG